MASRTELGTYLRTRRELVQPHEVGLVPGDRRRRVAGLRREEVAVLAGISAEYYLRLEQGRDRNPTKQVLDALARALLLDDSGSAYLYGLVHPDPSIDQAGSDDDGIRAAQWLIDSWPMTAAIILNSQMDVLASNRLMELLIPPFAAGNNTIMAQFTEPFVRTVYRDREGVSARSVALMRMSTGLKPEQPSTRRLISELSARSERFRELWDRNDVIRVHSGVHILDHPKVGELSLHFAHLPLAGTDDATIFAYHTEPGSSSESALAGLAATT